MALEMRCSLETLKALLQGMESSKKKYYEDLLKETIHFIHDLLLLLRQHMRIDISLFQQLLEQKPDMISIIETTVDVTKDKPLFSPLFTRTCCCLT